MAGRGRQEGERTLLDDGEVVQAYRGASEQEKCWIQKCATSSPSSTSSLYGVQSQLVGNGAVPKNAWRTE